MAVVIKLMKGFTDQNQTNVTHITRTHHTQHSRNFMLIIITISYVPKNADCRLHFLKPSKIT